MAPPPRVEQTVTPRRSPQLAAQIIRKETKDDAPAHNTRNKQAHKKSSTQDEILMYLHTAHQKLAPDRLAQRRFPLKTLSAVLDKETGELMEYWRLIKNPKDRNLYRNSYAKEIRHLEQGIPGLLEITNTMFLIDKKAIPAGMWRDITYGRVVVDYRPEKSDPYRTRLKVGGDRVNYP